jgi:transposase
MGVRVPRTRPPYPPELRAEAVRVLRATGRTPQQVADDLGASRQSVANWARQADRDDGLRDDGLTTAERGEPRRLRREVRDLREERDVLKKAAAFFAREAGRRWAATGWAIREKPTTLSPGGAACWVGRARAATPGRAGAQRRGGRGRSADRADPRVPGAQPWHPRRPKGPRRAAAGPRRPCRPQAGGQADALGWAGRLPPGDAGAG